MLVRKVIMIAPLQSRKNFFTKKEVTSEINHWQEKKELLTLTYKSLCRINN